MTRIHCKHLWTATNRSWNIGISLHDGWCSLWTLVISCFILPEISSQISNLSFHSTSQLPSPELKTRSQISVCYFRWLYNPFICFCLVVCWFWHCVVGPKMYALVYYVFSWKGHNVYTIFAIAWSTGPVTVYKSIIVTLTIMVIAKCVWCYCQFGYKLCTIPNVKLWWLGLQLW